jgi:hypothetical protein
LDDNSTFTLGQLKALAAWDESPEHEPCPFCGANWGHIPGPSRGMELTHIGDCPAVAIRNALDGRFAE